MKEGRTQVDRLMGRSRGEKEVRWNEGMREGGTGSLLKEMMGMGMRMIVATSSHQEKGDHLRIYA